MSWDGAGSFVRTNGSQSGSVTWANARDAANNILASQHDTHDQDLADGIAACLTKNNESKPTVSFKPNADNSIDLGSSTLRWRRIFVAEVRDTNANEVVTFAATASAVNEFTITNAATGNGPTISATGGDANININLTPKGNGAVTITGTQSANGNEALNVVASSTLTGAAVAAGSTVTMTSAHTASGSTTGLVSGNFVANHAVNFNLNTLAGVVAAVDNNTSAGTLDSMRGVSVGLTNTAGTVTDMKGVLIGVTDSASATNAYGVFVTTVTGATNNWAFYSADTPAASAIGGTVYIGDTANANVTLGLTINQGAADDQILALKSSDIGHGVTSVAETDTFGFMGKINATGGGLEVTGMRETGATSALNLVGYSDAADTTPSTSAIANVNVHGLSFSGANAANMAANALVFGIRGQVGGSLRGLFFVDEDGDFFADGAAGAAFDAWDDVALVRAFDRERVPEQVIRSEFDDFVKYGRHDLVRAGIITDPQDGGDPMVNVTQLQRLHNGAIWQLGTIVKRQAEEIEQLKRALPAPN